MQVTLTNIGQRARSPLTPTAAIPLYGRSADNLRDHRHVTSLLHRIRAVRHGVLVRPTLSFDERGHRPNARDLCRPGRGRRWHAAGGLLPRRGGFRRRRRHAGLARGGASSPATPGVPAGCTVWTATRRWAALRFADVDPGARASRAPTS